MDLRRLFDESPYAKLLGMRVVDLSEGRATVQLPVRDDFANFAGLTHGGLLMSLADHAFGCALNTLDRTYVAVQFNLNFVGRAAVGDTLLAEGRVLRAGRSTGHGEMVVRDQRGNLVAEALGAVVALDS
jgi:acyl-CoA thioesterase